MPYTSKINKGFRDNKTGKGFFIPLDPQFATLRGAIGGRLGIHPDGDPPGTKGCIGIKQNAKGFYDAIAGTSISASITLEVIN